MLGCSNFSDCCKTPSFQTHPCTLTYRLVLGGGRISNPSNRNLPLKGDESQEVLRAEKSLIYLSPSTSDKLKSKWFSVNESLRYEFHLWSKRFSGCPQAQNTYGRRLRVCKSLRIEASCSMVPMRDGETEGVADNRSCGKIFTP